MDGTGTGLECGGDPLTNDRSFEYLLNRFERASQAAGRKS